MVFPRPKNPTKQGILRGMAETRVLPYLRSVFFALLRCDPTLDPQHAARVLQSRFGDTTRVASASVGKVRSQQLGGAHAPALAGTNRFDGSSQRG
eukprot:3343284-Amphidinium_carterae.1